MDSIAKKNAPKLIEDVIQGVDVIDVDNLIDIATTDWDEEQRNYDAWMAEEFPEGRPTCGFMQQVNEIEIAQVMWKRLPSRMRGHVDIKKLRSFIQHLEDGDNLESAARNSGLPTATATELMVAIERMGLL